MVLALATTSLLGTQIRASVGRWVLRVAGYRSSGSVRRQGTVSATRLPSISAGRRAVIGGALIMLRGRRGCGLAVPGSRCALVARYWREGQVLGRT
jgi:hypothetical protein